jgi:hypothetical protein
MNDLEAADLFPIFPSVSYEPPEACLRAGSGELTAYSGGAQTL